MVSLRGLRGHALVACLAVLVCWAQANTLTLYTMRTDMGLGTALDSLVAGYNAHAATHNLSTSILVTSSPFNSVLSEYVDIALQPSPHDLVVLHPSQGMRGLLDDALLVNLSSLWGAQNLAADMVPPAVRFCSDSSGVPRAVPIASFPEVCHYRASVFDTHSLAPPETWSQLLTVCRILTRAGIGCLGTDYASLAPSQYLDYLFLRMHGGELYDEFAVGNLSFTDDRLHETLARFVDDIIAPGYLSRAAPGNVLTSNSEFAAGSLGIICTFEEWAIAFQAFGLDPSDLRTFAFPRYDGPPSATLPPSSTSTYATLGLVAAVGIPSHSANVDLTKTVLATAFAPASTIGPSIAAAPHLVPPYTSLASMLTTPSTVSATLLIANSPSLHSRSSIASFPYRPLLTAWRTMVTHLMLAASAPNATVIIDSALPRLEGLRVAFVDGVTVTPIATPSPGSYIGPISVSLECYAPDSSIRFSLESTVNGASTPLAPYRQPVVLSAAGTYTLYATAVGGPAQVTSPTLRALYVLVDPPSSPSAASTSSGKTALLAASSAVSALCCCTLLVVIAVKLCHFARVSPASPIALDPTEINITAALDKGTLGTVYSASFRGEAVVCKHLRVGLVTPAMSDQFSQRCTKLASLTSPTIVPLLGFVASPPSLIMPRLARGSVHDVLHDSSLILHPTIVCEWAHQMALGLKFLSDSGFVHGNFKSRNALITESWSVRVADFGLCPIIRPMPVLSDAYVSRPRAPARAEFGSSIFASSLRKEFDVSESSIAFDFSPVSQARSLTMMSSVPNEASDATGDSPVVGTADSAIVGASAKARVLCEVGAVFWKAPEILTIGPAALSVASDAYALGMTLWELATRSELFLGRNPLATVLSVVHSARRPPLYTIPPSLAPLGSVAEDLWTGAPADRLSLDDACARLATLYTPGVVIRPSPQPRPVGNFIVVHAAVLHATDALRKSPSQAAGVLRLFVDFSPTLPLRYRKFTSSQPH
ncbi:uncharacterized protein AMSG_11583 [Thecamonas trahens ATCC 50062]|uniref:Protein kinase domain-containing protein n=1 Tax=Thecamonas trahens ATCC 50062 TaxID=461836 RepID=A0A0L0D3K6_THETB|nr:hypothetical protein AMSG_11583 [Thecamonas trahens ATCC 50062]KNC45888.1 hypothetical protein AMSG_11583 [Thecamonas trahens ATCC 50062]|eukprot:XP_013763181.1 hypothetical protein AMSG_11583 [Thecamonas trahens ATCC 50062]